MKMTLVSICLFAGCEDSTKEFVSECTADAGYDEATEPALQGLDAANCYRVLMGTEPGSLNVFLDAASQGHAEYMEALGAITHQQANDDHGFTGEWVWDRIVTHGYDYVPGTMVSEVVSFGYDPAGAVDAWMNSVYHRLPFTLPAWVEVGFGQEDLYSSMTFISPWPDGVRTAIIYPVDGQGGVNPIFNSDWEMPDPAPDHGEVGTPITVTVGDESAPGSSTNPYDLQLLDAVLTGPGGEEVAVLLSDPSDDGHLYQMAMMLPVDPLEPEAEYTATMTVEWGGESQTLTAAFTTGQYP